MLGGFGVDIASDRGDWCLTTAVTIGTRFALSGWYRFRRLLGHRFM